MYNYQLHYLILMFANFTGTGPNDIFYFGQCQCTVCKSKL